MSRQQQVPPVNAPAGMRPRNGNQAQPQPQGQNQMSMTTPVPRPTTEQIAQRAYALFEARGKLHGFDQEDWVQAERELMLGRR